MADPGRVLAVAPAVGTRLTAFTGDHRDEWYYELVLQAAANTALA
jgi:hypothetical protein